jgi:hypothetical protein
MSIGTTGTLPSFGFGDGDDEQRRLLRDRLWDEFVRTNVDAAAIDEIEGRIRGLVPRGYAPDDPQIVESSPELKELLDRRRELWSRVEPYRRRHNAIVEKLSTWFDDWNEDQILAEYRRLWKAAELDEPGKGAQTAAMPRQETEETYEEELPKVRMPEAPAEDEVASTGVEDLASVEVFTELKARVLKTIAPFREEFRGALRRVAGKTFGERNEQAAAEIDILLDLLGCDFYDPQDPDRRAVLRSKSNPGTVGGSLELKAQQKNKTKGRLISSRVTMPTEEEMLVRERDGAKL